MPLNQTANSSPTTRPTRGVVDPQTFLRFGSKGEQVSSLQSRLAALHYNVGAADSHFGQKTLDAVKAFQRAKGLVADGVVGPKTAEALGISLSATPRHPADGTAHGKTLAANSAKNTAQELVEKFVSIWSTDEEGLAHALYNRGKDITVVTTAFKLLDEEWTADSDDVALEYVKLVQSRGGLALEMLKTESALRELLIDLLATGVSFPDEDKHIQFLRGLAGPSTSGSSSALPSVEAMVQAALAQKGKDYVYGVEVKASDTQAKAFDCSELVEWAVSRAGGFMPDGSQAQREYCRKHKTTLPVEEAIKTRGALLFTDTHVAISLGDGTTIEAANSKKGVCILKATGRGWKEAGLVPGLSQGTTTLQKSPSKTQSSTSSKTDTKASANKASSPSTGDESAGTVINGYVIYPNEVRGQGTIAWRNNNPGNIRNGAFADTHGAFKGKNNRRFAIFPDHATGFAALLALLKTQAYQPLSVMKAMARYAPSTDSNDPVAYARTLSKLTGLDVDRTLSSLNDAELRKFATAIQKVEGWKAGVVYSRSDPRLAELGIKLPSTGGKPNQALDAAKASMTVAKSDQGSKGKQTASNTSPTKVTPPAVAHQETLKKLGQQARLRMSLYNKGLCAKGVCEMLGAVGYACASGRPYVSSGIISRVYDYGTGRWSPSSTKGYYVSKHSHLDNKTHVVKSEANVKCASAMDSAKFMKHTLEMLKFVECTPPLHGHGSMGTPPEESVKALRALPEGTVVVFGPALSRSVEKIDGKYALGGTGHAGHVGVLLREGKDVLVVADGLLVGNGSKYTVESCLSSYAWAVGFVPTTAPLKVNAKDRPANTA
ncbi:peptidoglycan-binding protein [Archangium violaceum]|uniref:peptidoglycan-binding protein n=1 Tax=Archangium violaceum TaxID=83451 RepID=UPI00194E48D6|nr:peptidoglycan-binding protein [Archangium violaceum]QRN99142.1 peptidoglycan-binding protein [Archangium violaceum]